MTPPADERFGQNPPPLEEDLAERLLRGDDMPPAAPIRYATLCSLLGNTRALSENRFGDDEALRRARQFLALATGDEPPSGRIAPLVASRKVRVTAIFIGAMLSTGSVAAAATGNLPAPAQRALANVATGFGLTLPAPKNESAKVPGIGPANPAFMSEEDDSLANSANTDHLTESTPTLEPAPPNSGPLPESTTMPPNAPTTSMPQSGTQPGKDSCAEARLSPDANGCSDVAKGNAPGQQRRELAPDITPESVRSEPDSNGRENSPQRPTDKRTENPDDKTNMKAK